MRRKKLLTAALCAVLMVASYTVSSMTGVSVLNTEKMQIVLAAETDAQAAEETGDTPAPVAETPSTSAPAAETSSTSSPAAETPGTSAPAAETPGTSAPDVEAPDAPAPPAQTETSAPATETPGTSAPSTENIPLQTETSAPVTEAPTEVPSTQAPTETTGATETLPSETTSSTEASPGTEQLPSETTPDTEQMTPGTEQLPGETAPATEQPTESESNSESEQESESETSKYNTNEELIANQKIVIPPDIALEFRFTQVDKCYAIVSDREGAAVYEEKSEDAREVGVLQYYGCCYILEDAHDGWYYVESGNVRGFVKSDMVVADDVAERIISVKGLETLPEARLLVARTENEAFDYTHTTVQEVMAEKVYAIASGEVTIYEQRKTAAKKIGVLADGALCYILADESEEWIFVESGNARGFVNKSDLITGSAADAIVSAQGENNIERAEILVEPEDNKSCYYTLTSVQKASQASKTREAMVDFALQFVGNPYVWGGTSLTNGADCSGFVQSIYSYFGYSIPRVAEDQSGYGMQIPISSAEPGDLIFYARNGYVYHVSMYIGDGRVVQAANKNAGIITSGIGGDAVWATRIITE